VGCGNGGNLLFAHQLGWDCLGLEIDGRAAEAARTVGVRVEEGNFYRLEEFPDVFDCVVCSHVVEHVHAPIELLKGIVVALKPGGTALISLPNATSAVLDLVGINWRGLEAPRHLSIPAHTGFVRLLNKLGLHLRASQIIRGVTIQQSLEIARRRGVSRTQVSALKSAIRNGLKFSVETSDFISLELQK
jgi:SAM-dependent methyltransferase